MNFEFAFATDALFGFERYTELPTRLAERGWSKLGWVIDGALAESQCVVDLMDRASVSNGADSIVFTSRTDAEPDYDYLDAAANVFRGSKVDCLIGIGGGSAMDLCKGICVLMTNPGRGIDYRGIDRVKQPRLPCVLIPATAGTGSEATFTAVFVDRNSNAKFGINGRHVGCDLALLDATFTASCPHRVAVGAGLDAMVHSLEAFMTTACNPIVHDLAQQAWMHLFRAFPRAVGDPEAHDGRMKMLLGSYLAGITLRYSRGGVAGALSYPLGAEFGVPHGLAGGLLLPHLIRENVERGYEGFADLHARLFPQDALLPPTERSQRFVSRFDDLFAAIRAPLDFSGFAVTRADIPHIVEQSLTQRGSVLNANPVPAETQSLSRLLEAVVPA